MDIKLESAIYLVGIFQCIPLIVLGLFSSKAPTTLNKYVIAFVILVCLHLVDGIFYAQNWYSLYPHFSHLVNPSMFLFGPMFYYAVLTISTESIKRDTFKRHFIPFAISIVLHLPYYFSYSTEEKLALVNFEPIRDLYFVLIFGVLGLLEAIQIGYYIRLSLVHLKKHHEYIKNHFSFQENISLNWIKNIIYSAIILFALFLFDSFFLDTNYDIIGYVLVLWILYFSVQTFTHLEQFPVQTNNSVTNSQSNQNEKKNATNESTINSKYENEDPTNQLLMSDLMKNVRSQKLFLRSDLTLEELSLACLLTRHQASHILNNLMQTNFYDYINQLRIEYSKHLLLDVSYKRNVLAVSLDSGFKSRSAFYSAFKKWVGITPTQFLKQQN